MGTMGRGRGKYLNAYLRLKGKFLDAKGSHPRLLAALHSSKNCVIHFIAR